MPTIYYKDKNGNIKSGVVTSLSSDSGAASFISHDHGAVYSLAAHTHTGYAEVVSAPSAADDTGTAGQIAYDASYVYVCVDTDTWLRASIATWS